ncbi:MAG: hypothetical protein EXR76_00360 [Myxococcales bacterium]|nr:hypothetical protein [Myxococcales bacterium]
MSTVENGTGRTSGAAESRVVSTTVICGGCDAIYGATYTGVLNASTSSEQVEAFRADGFGGMNRSSCPKCDALHVIEEACVVVVPELRRVYIVVPDGQRHATQSRRAAFIRDVESCASGLVDPYLLEPIVVVGAQALGRAVDGLRFQLSARPSVTLPPTAEPARLSVKPVTEPAVSLAVSPAVSLTAPMVALPMMSEPETPPVVTAPVVTQASTPKRSVQSARPIKVPPPLETLSVDVSIESVEASVSVDVGSEVTAVRGEPSNDAQSGPSPMPSVPVWNAEIDAGWAMENEAPSGLEDPTHVVQVEKLVPTPKRAAGPTFDTTRAGLSDGYLTLVDDRVLATVRTSLDRANAFAQGEAALGFQYHVTPSGPVLDLMMSRSTGGDIVDHLYWVVEPDAPGVSPIIDALCREFSVDVVLHQTDGSFVARRMFQEPLAANVQTAVSLWRQSGRRGDSAAARRLFEAPEYDRVGRLKHNFTADTFEVLMSARAARLALGIVAYWSAPERREYLTRVRSFPEAHFEAIVLRVLRFAIDFGLSMEPHLRQRAIDLGLAESSTHLLRSAVSNFAEVCLNLKPNELEPLDVWENWESLFAFADELEEPVDEEIEDLAAMAMERAREAAQNSESGERSTDEDSIELLEAGELSDLRLGDLEALLAEPGARVEASLALLSRGASSHAISIFEAMRRMSRDQLLRVVPAALALGPAFEGSFLGALRSKRVSFRLVAGLFLAEIRSERAVTPLLVVIQAARPEEWQFFARACARMGRRILGPTLKRVSTMGDKDGRLAFALALLGPEARSALAAASERETNENVRSCLKDAMNRASEVSFGDPADFQERLSDAFSACGPDAVGPDFDEDLESVDLGPGASVHDLDGDVEIEGLETGRLK